MATQFLINTGTAKSFKATTGDVAITIDGTTTLANNGRRISAQADLGVFPKTDRYEWRAKAKFSVAPTVGNSVMLYWSSSDGSIQDGNVGVSDAAIAADDKLKNLKYIGRIIVDISNTTDFMQASGEVTLTTRYGSLVVKNSAGQAMNDFEFTLTELISEVVTA